MRTLVVGAIGLAAVSLNATGDTLEEIVITGEKVERSLFETTSSVGVITGAQIEQRGIGDLQDIFAQTAGISQSFGGEGFAIRGIQNSSFFTGSIGNNPLATLYIDGAEIGDFGIRSGQLDVWDVAQVEVFRGAQSTIQGRNSLAGSVKVRSADPSFDFEGKLRAQGGNFDSWGIAGVINLPLIENELALRIAAEDKSSDGYIDNITLDKDDYAQTENTLLRAKLLWEPSDNFRGLLTLSSSKNESGDDVVNADEPHDFEVASNLVGFEDVDQDIATLELDFALSDTLTFRSITSFNRTDYSRFVDDDQANSGGDQNVARKTDTETLSQELRLEVNNDNWRGNIGIYYLEEENDTELSFLSGFSVVGLLPPAFAQAGPFIAPFYDNPFLFARDGGTAEQDKENIALYADFEYRLNERLDLLMGLRYDREDQELKGTDNIQTVSALPDPALVPAIPLAPGITLQTVVLQVNGFILANTGSSANASDTDYDALLPKLGLRYLINDDLSTSFVIQRGYRAGGSGVDAFLGIFEFDPEFTTNYEFSVRQNLFDNSALLSANVFYIDWEDQQVRLQDPATGGFFIENAGESRLYGLEAELSGSTGSIDYFINASFTDTEFKEFFSSQGDFEGDEFPSASKWSLAAGLTYRADNGFYVGGNANFLDEAFDQVPNELINDKRTVVNARTGYEFGNYNVNLQVNNLLDEEYITSNVRDNGVLKVGAPRSYTIEFTAQW